MRGNFSCFCHQLTFFSKFNFFKIFFREHYQCQTVWIQGPNCLQKLSADDTSRCLQGKRKEYQAQLQFEYCVLYNRVKSNLICLTTCEKHCLPYFQDSRSDEPRHEGWESKSE